MKDYQQQAKRTCASLGSEKLDLAHMILGITSELNELEDAIDNDDRVNIGEEIVDAFWYLANYCTFRGWNFNDFLVDKKALDGNSHILQLYYETSKLSDIVKKYIAYNKLIDNKVEHEILHNVFYELCDLVFIYDLDINKILENNINKLKIRFPNQFTEENAINRNLENELKELKK